MQFIKKLIPESILKFIRPYYHGLMALVASVYFGHPSEKMVIIGVTGTTGKSSTVAMLCHILNRSGKKCGLITTVNFFDGDSLVINKHGLSMPGGWRLQKQLRQMLNKACKYAVIECTSEGLQQQRHLGINFDVAVFTNLSRAHLEAHGSFGNYRGAKGKMFAALRTSDKKSFFPKKIIGVNADDPISGFYLSFPADEKFAVSFHKVGTPDAQKVLFASLVDAGPPIRFEIDGVLFVVDMLGEFNAKNAALAVAAATALGVSLREASADLQDFHGVRGRMETVKSSLGFKIIVDYGCEPASFKAALEAAAQLPHNRLIHLFGSTGGHRDIEKRFIFGETSAQFADYIIVTNDDIYGSDPQEIANNIEQGIKSFKLRKPPYEIILDRRIAIKRALSIAQKDDILLLTGKGSEQFLVLPGNNRIEWDEVSMVREELAKLELGIRN